MAGPISLKDGIVYKPDGYNGVSYAAPPQENYKDR